MTLINPSHIILKPIYTESSLLDQSKGKYQFWVNTAANKNQIAVAFKIMFGIEPVSINTIKVLGKAKTNWKTRQPIKKSDRKKAIVTLPADQKLEILHLKTK